MKTRLNKIIMFSELPEDLLSMICTKLSIKDLNNLAKVCTKLYYSITTDTQIINSIADSVQVGFNHDPYELKNMDLPCLFKNCKLNDILKYILNKCSRPFARINYNNYLISYLCLYSNLNMVKYFVNDLKKGININKGYSGQNLFAVIQLRSCPFNIIEYLINNGALLNSDQYPTDFDNMELMLKYLQMHENDEFTFCPNNFPHCYNVNIFKSCSYPVIMYFIEHYGNFFIGNTWCDDDCLECQGEYDLYDIIETNTLLLEEEQEQTLEYILNNT